MTLEELGEIVASLRQVGADLTHVEAKRAARELPRRLWETLSAFANTPGGGVIILGVDSRITHADYRRLNPGLDSAEVTRHLADLVQRRLLNQHGTRRWTFYTLMIEPETAAPVSVSEGPETQPTQLPAQLPAHLPRRLSADLVRAAVLRLCLAQSWSAAELAARLGRNKRHLLQHYLSPLVTEGLLEMVGTAPTDPNLRYRTTDQGRAWLETHGRGL